MLSGFWRGRRRIGRVAARWDDGVVWKMEAMEEREGKERSPGARDSESFED